MHLSSIYLPQRRNYWDILLWKSMMSMFWLASSMLKLDTIDLAKLIWHICTSNTSKLKPISHHTRLIDWLIGGFSTDGLIPCNLLMLSSHSNCHLALMCVAISGFRSEWGIRQGSTSQFRAFFAARSANSFPWMSAWPSTQHRWISYPFDVNWFILWIIFATKGWAVFSPAMACRQENESL